MDQNDQANNPYTTRPPENPVGSRAVSGGSRKLLWGLLGAVVLGGVAVGGGYLYLDSKVRTDLDKLNQSLAAYLPGYAVDYDRLSLNVWGTKIGFKGFRISRDSHIIAQADTVYFSGIDSPQPEIINFHIEADDIELQAPQLSATENISVSRGFLSSMIRNVTTQNKSSLKHARASVSLDKSAGHYEVRDLFAKNAAPARAVDAYYLFPVLSLHADDSADLKTKGKFTIHGGGSAENDGTIDQGGLIEAAYFMEQNPTRFGLTNFLFSEYVDDKLREVGRADKIFFYSSRPADQHAQPFRIEDSSAEAVKSGFKIENMQVLANPSWSQYELFRAAGYERFFYNATIEMTEEAVGNTQIALSLNIKDMGKADFSIDLREFSLDPQSLSAQQFDTNAGKLALASLEILDQPGRNRFFNAYSALNGNDLRATLPLYSALLQAYFLKYPDDLQVQGIKNALAGFMEQGGRLRLTLSPAEPVLLTDLARIPALDPKEVIDFLKIQAFYEPVTQ